MNEQAFFSFLRDRIGLDVESVGAPMIERALRQRCTDTGTAHLEAYWSLLQQSDAEQQALIEAVIVPETWFFRYPESFAALVQLARKRLVTLGRLRPLRILSLPCSTGEEPYTIAMALLDAGVAASAVRIDAMDISPLSIARARHACYGRNAFRGSDLRYRDRYFWADEEGHHLDPRVREQVDLMVGNVLDPALEKRAGSYDFVFCRNLLIYFDVPTQQRVFEVLKRLLHPEGALFIGPAEGSLLARLGMRPLGMAQSFAYVRSDSVAQVPPSTPAFAVPSPRRQVMAAPLPNPSPIAAVPGAQQRSSAVAHRREPPSVIPTRDQVAKPSEGEDERSLLARIAEQADRGDSAEAQSSCERYLRLFAPDAQVYYWLGLLSDTAGDTATAQRHYRKALYLQPQHAEALAHLATLLAAQGDTVAAQRLQARATRAGQGGER